LKQCEVGNWSVIQAGIDFALAGLKPVKLRRSHLFLNSRSGREKSRVALELVLENSCCRHIDQRHDLGLVGRSAPSASNAL
jgi:hypothetical protein